MNLNAVILLLYSVELLSASTSFLMSKSAEQRRRTRLLLPISMPLTDYLRLIARALLLLFLCSSSSTPCFANPWDGCHSGMECGELHFSNPFGLRNSRCGDPHFLLDCDSNVPLLSISEQKYRILATSMLAINEIHSITIVNDNLVEEKCSNYSQEWWSGSNPFHIAAKYDNLTLWADCDSGKGNFKPPSVVESVVDFCHNDWYIFEKWIDGENKYSCKMHLQLPIKEHPFIGKQTLLDGFDITWQADRCDTCLNSSGTCGHSPSEPPTFLCYCPDGSSDPEICHGNGGRHKAIIIGCSIGGVALIALALILFLRFYAKKRKTPSRGLAAIGDMEAAILPPRKIGNLPIFSYEELRQATNCFHEDNEVGDGGFGSVYLGKLRDGRTVAVKRLYQDNSRRVQQFINEVEIFSTLKHPRVVRLYGCTSADSPELLLVYEFVANGTLADHLHGDRRGSGGLPWDTRLNISMQIAEALDFLHGVDPPIFHRDVKSSNILLDENFNVKVADFGLCRLVPVNASHVTTAPQGTPGYVDPEYHQCYQLTEKSDVYSFGVVLVEIISAKLAVDINRNRSEINLANMAKSKIQEGALHELVDPQLGIEMNHEVKVTVAAVAELAFRCLASERDDRPHMKEVVAQLEEIRQSWDTSIDADEQQRGSFSNIKQPLSPMSVQDKWSSISSTPNTSA